MSVRDRLAAAACCGAAAGTIAYAVRDLIGPWGQVVMGVGVTLLWSMDGWTHPYV